VSYPQKFHALSLLSRPAKEKTSNILLLIKPIIFAARSCLHASHGDHKKKVASFTTCLYLLNAFIQLH